MSLNGRGSTWRLFVTLLVTALLLKGEFQYYLCLDILIFSHATAVGGIRIYWLCLVKNGLAIKQL